LDQLAAAHTQVSANPSQPKVTITSMFRAKGLEWPLVFVPNCNQGTIPYERGESVEEERCLLYVAITRARQALYLYALRTQPLSAFLADAQAFTVVQQVATIQRALQSDPGQWRAAEMVALAVGSQRLHLASYFRDWWHASADQQKRIATLALRILDSLAQHQLEQQVGMQPQDRELWQTLAAR
jgi:DNA helicase-2/ATP-dependent DNA helicase PcrA